MTSTSTHFNPANQLMHEIKQLASEIHGTPAWAHFPRWYNNGQSMWTESSSGGRTLTVNFETGQVVIPQWKDGGRTEDMPAHWADLHRGSLFNKADGSAVHPELFAAAMAQDGWKTARA